LEDHKIDQADIKPVQVTMSEAPAEILSAEDEAARYAKEQKSKARTDRRALEEGESAEKALLKGLKADIKALEKELQDKKYKADKKVDAAADGSEDLQEEKDELQKKYDSAVKKSGAIDPKELEADRKKVEETEKIVAYLKKENKKVKEQTSKMQEDMQEMKEQNDRFVEANASAGASLDSMEKQKKNITAHNKKLDENVKKYKVQNSQLRRDLDNRNSYFEAETKIRGEYTRAMEEIIDMLEDKGKDYELSESVNAAQLQCEMIATHKTNSLSDQVQA
jgi:chromosome segregation ATPase